MTSTIPPRKSTYFPLYEAFLPPNCKFESRPCLSYPPDNLAKSSRFVSYYHGNEHWPHPLKPLVSTHSSRYCCPIEQCGFLYYDNIPSCLAYNGVEYTFPSPNYANMYLEISPEVIIAYDQKTNTPQAITAFSSSYQFSLHHFSYVVDPHNYKPSICDYVLQTNALLPADCALPDSCGTVQSTLIDSTWYGSKTYICRSIPASDPTTTLVDSGVLEILTLDVPDSNPGSLNYIAYDGVDYYLYPSDLLQYTWSWSESQSKFIWSEDYRFTTRLHANEPAVCYNYYTHSQLNQLALYKIGPDPNAIPEYWPEPITGLDFHYSPRIYKPQRDYASNNQALLSYSAFPMYTKRPSPFPPKCTPMRFSASYNVPFVTTILHLIERSLLRLLDFVWNGLCTVISDLITYVGPQLVVPRLVLALMLSTYYTVQTALIYLAIVELFVNLFVTVLSYQPPE